MYDSGNSNRDSATTQRGGMGKEMGRSFKREGEEGESEMYPESNMETYITICKIDSQWKFAV